MATKRHYKPVDELPESFIIFICKSDPFHDNLPRYTFNSVCREKDGISLDDKCTKVFYNASAYDDSKDEQLKVFLRFVCRNEAHDSFTRILEQRVRETIRSEIFRTEYMKMNIHDYDMIKLGREEGRTEGLAIGAQQKAIETARNLLNKNISQEIVAECTGLSLEEVLALKTEAELSAK